MAPVLIWLSIGRCLHAELPIPELVRTSSYRADPTSPSRYSTITTSTHPLPQSVIRSPLPLPSFNSSLTAIAPLYQLQLKCSRLLCSLLPSTRVGKSTPNDCFSAASRVCACQAPRAYQPYAMWLARLPRLRWPREVGVLHLCNQTVAGNVSLMSYLHYRSTRLFCARHCRSPPAELRSLTQSAFRWFGTSAFTDHSTASQPIISMQITASALDESTPTLPVFFT